MTLVLIMEEKRDSLKDVGMMMDAAHEELDVSWRH